MGSLSEVGTPSLAVRAHGVAFRYPGGRTGLEPLSLEVAPGEVVVVLGPNGSGKSTLLRLLATDLSPWDGSLELLGEEKTRPTPALRRKIAWVPDRPVHLEPLTGRENLRFFVGLSGGVGPDPRDPLDSFGLGDVADVPVAEYSFGMSRRLALAEAVGARPELLLLDEPTVGLDPEGVEALGREVGRAAERGCAVVVATNEVRESPRWATRILFLDRGRVVEDASPEALRARIPGGTRIRVSFEEATSGLPDPGTLGPGITVLEWTPRQVVVSAKDGGRVLPPLLQTLVSAGARIREVRLREPDLGDLFRELTGRELAPPENAR